MTLKFTTKKINQKQYYNAIRKCVMLNAADRIKVTDGMGKTYVIQDKNGLTPHEVWQMFKDTVTTHIMPVSETDKFKHMFKHLNIESNGKMAWGVTGKNEWYWFVTDSRNPRIFMQNLGPGFHECLHMMYQMIIGTRHIGYIYSDSPEVKRLPQSGPAATVIVHDNWYGSKKKIRVWFFVGIWVPVMMPYIPIENARSLYMLDRKKI